MIEGSGSGSVSLTSGSGSGRSKNIWILRISGSATLPNTALKRYAFSDYGLFPTGYLRYLYISGCLRWARSQLRHLNGMHSVITACSRQGKVPVHLWVLEVGEEHAYVAEERLVAPKVGEGGARLHRFNQPQLFLLHTTARRQGGGAVRCNITWGWPLIFKKLLKSEK